MAFPDSLKLVGRAAGPSVDVIVEISIACEVVGWTMRREGAAGRGRVGVSKFICRVYVL